MIIMFMRHADAKNDKLTKFGRRQAKLALKEKENIKFSKVYSSNTKGQLKLQDIFSLNISFLQRFWMGLMTGNFCPISNQKMKRNKNGLTII